MSRSIIFSLVLIIALTFMVSCSGGDENIVTPPQDAREVVSAETTGGTLALGLWQITIDPATGTGDIVQLRSADKIINVLGFMEPPPLTLMDLDWPNLNIDEPNNIIEVGVILKHPISGDPVFTGFDVRGVCFGPEVSNNDGLTIVTSPQYFIGVPFGYQDGLLGTPDSVANYSGLAGYKYFCDGLNATENLADFFDDPGNLADRGSYGSGQTNQRDYILDWTDSDEDFFIFNYAIYANYDWPVGGSDLDDFDIATANSAEAFCFSVTELANSLYYVDSTTSGGDLSLEVAIWDWQGDIDDVTIKSKESGILTEAAYDVSLGVYPGGKSYGFEFIDLAVTPTAVGDLDLIITATDTVTFGDAWFMDMLPTSNSRYNVKLYNCFLHTTTVSDCPPCYITDIDPDSAKFGTDLTDVDVTGTDILDGTSLGVVLKKTGESDIVATNVTWVSATAVTCDISIPDDEDLEGFWDVYLINGCGTPSAPLVDGFEVTTLYAEDFGTNPGTDWYFATYQYWSGCTQGTPMWHTGSPYGLGDGALQTSGNPTWGLLAGGAVSTMVSPPFACPTSSTVIFRCRVMWDLGGSYPYYTKTNFKVGNGSSPGLAPFNTMGTVGTVMLRNGSHGSANPIGWVSSGGSGPMSSRPGWQGSFNNWPSNITNYLDLTIPSAYHGDPNVKVAFQCHPDWCGYPGNLTGIVLDDVEILVF